MTGQLEPHGVWGQLQYFSHGGVAGVTGLFGARMGVDKFKT